MPQKVIVPDTAESVKSKDSNTQENSIQFLETTRKLREAQRVHMLSKMKTNTRSD